ncbi:MAG: peptidylprolyl isomerase [Flavobacteriales bacterium]|nr:peptidylprolyl isomerase [Flavobacteriales bacterium]
MKHTLLALALLSVVACDSPTSAEHDRPALNKWADDRLWAVLEAQEHRDTKALCLMLLDTSGTVREAAALALASVQDSTSRPCLLAALEDPLAAVRAQAAYALGLVADSAGLVLLNASADAERDATAQQLMHEAGFKAELALRKHDAMFLTSFLESENKNIRMRAVVQLARLPHEELAAHSADLLHALRVERDPVAVRALMSALRTDNNTATHKLLLDSAALSTDPSIRIAALRSLGAEKPWGRIGDSIFWPAVRDPDPGVSRTALDVLQKQEVLDGARCWKDAQQGAAPHIQFGLYGLALKHGDETTRRVVRDLLQSLKAGSLDPYAQAELLRAQASDPDKDMRPVLTEKFMANNPAVVRLAAAELAVASAREDMKRARYASREAQYAMLGDVLRATIGTRDAGLIAFACEQLAEEDSSAIRIMLHDSLVEEARVHLHPIRDLETLQLLDQAIAKRDGLPPPEHKAPPFNHPIDRDRLLQLKQGQRYRITTTKGEIIIATNVNETPGTSLVFDSLVTAGYYNGKAFHRVVPNFVIQGGCPRGDGYGGMPWTLRTEIGSTGFTAGSVGVASAGRDTESCQFFITHVPTPHLDGRYTKFAEVVSGMDVVQRIVVGDRMITVERVSSL